MIRTMTTKCMKKDFHEEIVKIHDRLKSGVNFAFSKYADGEWAAICNETLDNREFSNNESTPENARQELISSIRFQDESYYVGVCCPCCNGDRAYKMREFCGQKDANMTFANVFVNDNYSFYKENFINEYKNRDIHLVAHESSLVDSLPFKVERFYPIKRNAWVANSSLADQIAEENASGKTFLFCCGPLGNILSYKLFSKNRDNTYLDIGSTLNPWLRSEGFRRDYYSQSGPFANRKCVW